MLVSATENYKLTYLRLFAQDYIKANTNRSKMRLGVSIFQDKIGTAWPRIARGISITSGGLLGEKSSGNLIML